MTSKFLNPALTSVTDGSTNIFAATLSALNLTPSTTIKTDVNSVLVSEAILITDVTGLTAALAAGSGPFEETATVITPKVLTDSLAINIINEATGSGLGCTIEGIKMDGKDISVSTGTMTVTNTNITLNSIGDATLTINGDTDNSGENDNPSLVMSQDGGGQIFSQGIVGDAEQIYTGSSANAGYFLKSQAGNGIEFAINNQRYMRVDDTSLKVDNIDHLTGSTVTVQDVAISSNSIVFPVTTGTNKLKLNANSQIGTQVSLPGGEIEYDSSNHRFQCANVDKLVIEPTEITLLDVVHSSDNITFTSSANDSKISLLSGQAFDIGADATCTKFNTNSGEGKGYCFSVGNVIKAEIKDLSSVGTLKVDQIQELGTSGTTINGVLCNDSEITFPDGTNNSKLIFEAGTSQQIGTDSSGNLNIDSGSTGLIVWDVAATDKMILSGSNGGTLMVDNIVNRTASQGVQIESILLNDSVISSLDQIDFTTATQQIIGDAGGLTYKVPTADTHSFEVNSIEIVNIQAGGMLIDQISEKGTGGVGIEQLNVKDQILSNVDRIDFSESGQKITSGTASMDFDVPVGDFFSFEIAAFQAVAISGAGIQLLPATANRLLFTNTQKELTSVVDATAWVGGGDHIQAIDNGDGTMTLNNIPSRHRWDLGTSSGSTHTFVNGDVGELLKFTGAGSSQAWTLNTGLTAGFRCRVLITGTGSISISGTATLHSSTGGIFGTQYSVVEILYETTNTYVLIVH